jgi:ATP-dependent exoDNAse (exonuclease V) alpha subunit
LADLYDLDVDRDREPELGGYESNWVHEIHNQRSLLDAFAAHLRKNESLCFFYAKFVPFVEGTARILVGLGRVQELGQLIEYKREGDGMRGMVWERPVQHSIRLKGGEGFLIPYDDVLRRVAEDPTLDVERFVAKAPDDRWDEFSFASELVSHDGAIAALLSTETVLSRIETDLGIQTERQRKWVHEELINLWKVRGPFPGLGAVLVAFGISRGIFVAHALQQKAGENADPWPFVDRAFRDPSVLPTELRRDLKELAPTWKKLSSERKTFLRLLSRFELSKEQAVASYDDGARTKRGWGGTDREIVKNPYRIYELSRHDPEAIRLLTVDRGVFPDDTVRMLHPLEEPSGLESSLDLRRVRAFAVAALEEAADDGHTLLPQDNAVEAIRNAPTSPECPVTGDIVAARASDMGPEIVPISIGSNTALQLARYQTIGDLVRKQVRGRVSGKRHALSSDWASLVEKKFGPSTDAEEKLARKEKAAALKELAESRFSVLSGPAGAGKTTVLGILCSRPEIRGEGLLLLAPTGKARVRMQQLIAAKDTRALTIAQFLNQNGRYDAASSRYLINDRPKVTGYGTVIIDEASMLTEDMLGALFDSLQGVKRFVLVGDPAQLPPIGAGRSFVDIIAELRPSDYETRFPRIGNGYAELTIERRQIGNERPDLRLARWFSTAQPAPGDDDVFFCGLDEYPMLSFVEWQKPEDFQEKLATVIVKELQLSGLDDVRKFNEKLGAITVGEYDYFNASRKERPGAACKVDLWQILSPLRGMPFGVSDINRQIHERFRRNFLELASRQWRPIPKPLGAERIVYGDKVINLGNHRRDGKRVYPQEGAIGYLANGEIGITVGQWKNGANPKILHVEFSSQLGFTYSFFRSDFQEEGDPALELAYALTVHRAQGSQFKLVILVLPEDHPILSRELLYTAITRHQDRLVVMHQGPRSRLKDFAAPHRSQTAQRMTNLMKPCRMVEIPLAKGSVFLQDGLIHRTSWGLTVRSKSELIIAEALKNAGFTPEYEKPLTLGGKTRYPDFTVEDEIGGRTIYWEHLGMLEKEDYRRAWEAKLAWYRENGIMPADGGGGPNGMLITTTESRSGGFDVPSVQNAIRCFVLN